MNGLDIVKNKRVMVKESVRSLVGYEPKSINCSIKLDANEGKCRVYKEIKKRIGKEIDSNLELNLYPDDNGKYLKEKIKDYVNVETSNIVLGSGSSELVELIIKIFVDKDEVVLSFVPTFSMYEVYTKINSGRFVGVPCDDNFVVNIESIIDRLKAVNTKVVFLCNPNNPTGYLLKKEEIIKVLKSTNAIVVVDEAYMEFADEDESMIDEINNFDNLIVLKTFSKAFSLAALRVGYMISNNELASIINTVRPPYNLNTFSQLVASKALESKDMVIEYCNEIKLQRNYLVEQLNKLNIKVYDSQANFIFFSLKDESVGIKGDKLYEKLIKRDILIRDFGNFFRVTIGEEYENKAFISAMNEIIKG